MKRLIVFLLAALFLTFAALPLSLAIAGDTTSAAGASNIPVLQQDLIGRYYPNRVRFDIPCQRTATVQNVRVSLWDGPTGMYVFPSAAMQMQVVSDSAQDGVAGTGALTVHIHYLDNAYAVHDEVVTTNGVTPVLTTATNILRVNGFHVRTAGTSGETVGSVSLQAVGGAVTYAVIKPGMARARIPAFTIPAGHTGYITQWQASSASTGTHMANIDLQATTHEGVLWPGIFLYQDGYAGQNTGAEILFHIPLVLPATTDIRVVGISDAANANVTAVANVMGWYE